MFPKRCAVMAKKELKWSPLLGQWMSLSGAVFIDRGNSKKAMESLEKAGDDMKNHSLSLWMFPEGTRTSFETPNLLPFKKGAFHLAIQAGVPIVPVVCENYWRLYRKGVFHTGELKVKVLPPIQTHGLTAADVTQLANNTRELMLKTLQEISVPVSREVEESDNAALDAIAKGASKDDSSSHPPAIQPQVGIPKLPALAPSARPTEPGTAKSEPNPKAPPSPSSQGKDSSSEGTGRRSSGASSTDDEMVIVDHPPANSS